MIRKVKVLIVEDEVLVAKDIKMQLEELDYEVCQIATRADEAMRAMEIHIPDLILMDINIDGPFDGIETAEKIRLINETPIIFLTDLRDRETFDRAKMIGPAVFLNKPFNEYELGRHIDLAVHNASGKVVTEDDEGATRFLKDFFWVKDGVSQKKKPIQDILWIKADGAYCEVVTAEKNHKLSKNMREINDLLDNPIFTKVHKSYIVNIERVTEMKGSSLRINENEIPIGKTFLQAFKERLKLL